MTAEFIESPNTQTFTQSTEPPAVKEFQGMMAQEARALKIISVVCAHYGISSSYMTSRTRRQPYAFYRQVAMAMVRINTTLPLQSIAEIFNRKDHGTVIFAEKKVRVQFNLASEHYQDLLAISKKIKEALS